MTNTSPAPPAEVTRSFGIQIIESLGGRRNRHWLVARRSERLILRRWGGTADGVAYESDLLARIAALGWPVATPLAGPLTTAVGAWSLFPFLFLPGEPPPLADSQAEGRAGVS